MEDQFNVRWNDHTTVIIQSIAHKLEQDKLTDVVLACEGQTVKCHRLILSVCSPYLDKILAEFPMPNLVIFLNNMKFWELEALINFMYRGEVTVTQEKLGDLCKAAEQLQIKGLAKHVDFGDVAAFGTRGGGDGPAVKERLDKSMVDLLHYGNGSESNQRVVSGGQRQKSLLRPLSNLPVTRKIQEVFRKAQQESPRLIKVPRVERASHCGGAVPIAVKTSSPKACHLRSGPVGDDGNVVGVVGQLHGATATNSILILDNVNHFGVVTASPEKKSQNQEMKKEDAEPQGNMSHRTAEITELKKAKANVRTFIPTAQSSTSTTPSALESVDRKQRLEQAAMCAASSNKTVKQAALEYEIPRTTLCAYMKRKGISANQMVSNNDAGAGTESRDLNSDSDHIGQGKDAASQDGDILGTNGSVDFSNYVGVDTIDID